MSARISRPKPEHITEAEFRRVIIDALNRMPGVWVHNNAQVLVKGRGRVGLGIGSPDIIGHVDSEFSDFAGLITHKVARFFALELKRPGAAPRRDQAHQDAWAMRHRQMGAFVGRVAPALTVQEGIDLALAAVERCRRGEVG